MKRIVPFSYSLLLLALVGCSGAGSSTNPPLFQLLDPSHTGVDFVNTLVEGDSLNVIDFDYMYNGGGVAVGDFNNDSLPDLFFTGNNVSCRLYLNQGKMQFKDVTEAAGLSTTQWAEGVTLADLNHDGLLDIYVSTSSGYKKQPNANLLFINGGVSAAGVPSFTESAAAWGIADAGYNTQSAFFDYDLDGDLDLYVASNTMLERNRNRPRPRQLDGKGNSNDKLYRNNGNSSFTNVSAQAGILAEGYGLGLAIADINKDGWPDIYVANDFISNDLLYINKGDGTFSNQIENMLRHQSMNSMGVDIADFNNDALADIMVVDMMPDKNPRQKSMFPSINYDRYHLDLRLDYEPQFVRNTLQLNQGMGPNGQYLFSEIGQLAGVYKTDWSWTPLFADFDNDGLKDLFISNGYGKDVTDLDFIAYHKSNQQFGTAKVKSKKAHEEMDKLVEVKIPNFIFKNRGDLQFSDESENWGLVHASVSNGAAYTDLDGDGDLDLVINNVNDKAYIYQNNSKPTNYLQLEIKGDSLNRQGLGSKITLSYQKDNKREKQYYEHYLTRGYKSSVDPRPHFGLGSAQTIDSLEIIWPDGRYQLLRNVKPRQRLLLDYRHAQLREEPQSAPVTLSFQEVSEKLNIRHKHQYAEFVDFKMQALLPHKHSEGGPGLAVGDVNGDGLEDFYIGGSRAAAGTLYLQNGDGRFTEKSLLERGSIDEMGCLLFDADADGDLDLYLVSGGTSMPAEHFSYQDRLYLNDGAGNFTHQPEALPPMPSSGAVVTAADFDADGDLDLFVGGRIVPHAYPMPARSYLLENEKGIFKDITARVAPALEKPGLVTAALWSDVDADGLLDLLVTGEWMPLMVFKQEKGAAAKRHFKDITEDAGLAHTTGWWNSLAAGDFDADGDMDYVAGNLGLNSRYKASEQKPITLFAKDFDRNGTTDPIMFHYIGEESYPAHPRDALTTQLPYMRDRFNSYAAYGAATIHSFFAKEELEGALKLESVELRSMLIENRGGGRFGLKALPVAAQLAPVKGLLVKDVNGDGKLDLLSSGNFWAAEVLSGRYDASIGAYLLGDGGGNFKAVPMQQSGFCVSGDARAMSLLAAADGSSLVLVSQFGDKLKVFKASAAEGEQLLRPQPLDQRAMVYFSNGQKLRQEFSYGSGYLSQPSRSFKVGPGVDSVVVHDYSGKSRTYTYPPKVIAIK